MTQDIRFVQWLRFINRARPVRVRTPYACAHNGPAAAMSVTYDDVLRLEGDEEPGLVDDTDEEDEDEDEGDEDDADDDEDDDSDSKESDELV